MTSKDIKFANGFCAGLFLHRAVHSPMSKLFLPLQSMLCELHTIQQEKQGPNEFLVFCLGRFFDSFAVVGFGFLYKRKLKL